MASDDENQNMKDLFGSDDDDDDDFGKGNLRQATQKGDDKEDGGDEAEASPEDVLEDDLDDGVVQATGRQLPASEEPEEQVNDDDRDRWDRRRKFPSGHRPLARTGAPIDYSAPLLPVPPPQGEVYLLREALIGVEPTPFNPETFAGEEEIFVDEKGIMKVKPVDRTKIRWRYGTRRGPNGSEELVPESNARFVRWSDGSLQLLLGDEVFDVVTADISQQRAYMVAYSGVVQGQAAMTQKMGFRLATLNSKLYARMREEVDKRTVKVKRVQQHVEAMDPTREKERRAREAEELLRARAQLEARQQRTMARYAGAGGGRFRGSAGGRPQLNTRFLEEEDGIEVGGDDAFIDDEDDDGGGYSRRRRMNDEEEEEAARRLQSAKRSDGGAAHGAGGRRRSRAKRGQSEEEEEPEEEEEEEEYVDSEGGSDDGDDGEEEDGGEEDEEPPPGRRGKTSPPKAGKGTPPPPPPRSRPSLPAREARPPAAKVRRGVVLSDDEDD